MGWFSNLFSNNSPKKPSAEEEGAAGKGKKKLEINIGPDGKPAYTGEQLQTAVSKYKSRKMAVAKAREEEKAYVEHRKAEILRQFQPKVGTLRLGDEAFPKRRRVAMGFGERKAHYLAIRPKPKYASWIGRKKGIIQARARGVQTDTTNAIVTDHSAVPEGGDNNNNTKEPEKEDKKEEKSGPVKVKKEEKAEKSAGHKENPKPQQQPAKVVQEDSNIAVERKLPKKPLLNVPPLDIGEFRGVPFWIPLQAVHVDGEQQDDDLPVDMDILEKVCAGQKSLDHSSYIKKEFDPYGPIARFRQDDILFKRDSYLFANTVESVIGLQPETKRDDSDFVPQIKRVIQWNDTATVTTFNPNFRRLTKPDKSFTEPLKQILREKKKP